LEKINKFKKIFVHFLLELVFIFSSTGYSHSQPEKDTFQKVIFFIDFTDYNEGSIDKWLKDKDFELKRDVRDHRKLNLNVSNKGHHSQL